jgi:hypothetical protein
MVTNLALTTRIWGRGFDDIWPGFSVAAFKRHTTV